MGNAATIRGFFDERTNTISYLVSDPATSTAAVIDPVLDFDPVDGTIATESAERILAAASEQELTVAYVLETHPHADHLSAAPLIKARTGAKTAIGAGVCQVQKAFAPMFCAGDLTCDGGDFDLLLNEGDRLPLGELIIEVIATPGHTPACVSYRIGDAVFVGDTLFMPDYGTARTDFPGGDARQLYRSIQKLLALPPETRLFMCHDYKAPERDEFRWETTVGEERANNVHIGGGIGEEEFVALRKARDQQLCTPKLLYPAIQVNIRGGRLPPPDENGAHYLRIPLKVPEGAGLD
jgi:glyoxylase-like metal-dependent hydrolase (beta-lactamase superfamily II)